MTNYEETNNKRREEVKMTAQKNMDRFNNMMYNKFEPLPIENVKKWKEQSQGTSQSNNVYGSQKPATSEDTWKRNNREELKYAGDGAKESVNKGLQQTSRYMKDAYEGAKLEEVQTASVKHNLAHDSNNKDLINSSFMELIGRLSKENKETYLKHVKPLKTYIDAKDEFDYKTKNYTTNKNLKYEPDDRVKQIQRALNNMGYKDKFGNALKEDGLVGGKTLFAYDTYINDEDKAKIEKVEDNSSRIYGNRATMPSRSGSSTRTRADNLNSTYTHESGVTKWRELPDVSQRIPKEHQLHKEGKISDRIYKAMDNLSQRWYYADTDGARTEISRLAKSVRDNNYTVKDCTEEANKQLRDNRKEILDFMMDKIKTNDMFTEVDYAMLGYEWFKYVRPKGDWDYKVKGAHWIPEEKYFLYYGQIINDNDFGNINFGYTGTILGLSPETLYKGGGKVATNPTKYEDKRYYSDSEVDHYWIKKGIEQANQLGYVGHIKLPVEMLLKYFN